MVGKQPVGRFESLIHSAWKMGWVSPSSRGRIFNALLTTLFIYLSVSSSRHGDIHRIDHTLARDLLCTLQIVSRCMPTCRSMNCKNNDSFLRRVRTCTRCAPVRISTCRPGSAIERNAPIKRLRTISEANRIRSRLENTGRHRHQCRREFSTVRGIFQTFSLTWRLLRD